jgi:FkbM family methyltransferase
MHRVGGRDQSVLALEDDWRTFEAPMPAVFWALCCGLPGHVVDVGANTGIYALIALLSDRHREVTAFEPVPAIRQLLAANMALGGHTKRACLLGAAVGAESGAATLFVPPSASDDYVETSASLSADFKGVPGDEIQVPVTTLDAWWTGAGSPAVSVVKIDVESREYDVLRGADRLVAAQQPVLFYELLPQGDAQGIGSWARDRDLVDVRLRPDRAVVGAEPIFDRAAWNHMLVPQSQLPLLETVLSSCGLAVSG